MPTMPEAGPEVHLAIGSRFENIEFVKTVVDDALQQLPMDADARQWVELAVREAVANAIKHGNQQDPDKRVEVDLAVEGDEIIIRVEDQGGGFDPAAVQDPLRPENRFKPGGRGIFYMKSFMDHVDYTFRPEGGTILTLRKRVSGAGPDKAADKVGKEERA